MVSDRSCVDSTARSASLARPNRTAAVFSELCDWAATSPIVCPSKYRAVSRLRGASGRQSSARLMRAACSCRARRSQTSSVAATSRAARSCVWAARRKWRRQTLRAIPKSQASVLSGSYCLSRQRHASASVSCAKSSAASASPVSDRQNRTI